MCHYRWVESADGERIGVGVRLSGHQIATDALLCTLQRDLTAGRGSVGTDERKVGPVQVTMCSRLDVVGAGVC